MGFRISWLPRFLYAVLCIYSQNLPSPPFPQFRLKTSLFAESFLQFLCPGLRGCARARARACVCVCVCVCVSVCLRVCLCRCVCAGVHVSHICPCQADCRNTVLRACSTVLPPLQRITNAAVQHRATLQKQLCGNMEDLLKTTTSIQTTELTTEGRTCSTDEEEEDNPAKKLTQPLSHKASPQGKTASTPFVTLTLAKNL